MLKTRIDFYDFDDLTFGQTDYEVRAQANLGSNIPNFGIPVPIPSFGPLSAFPSEFLQIGNFVNQVRIDTSDVTISFSNTFPFPIGAGTEIVIRDSANTSTELVRHVIPNDLASGAPFELDVQVNNLLISNTLEIFVDQFQTPGTTTPVNVNTTDELAITVTVNLLVIDFAEILPDIDYSIDVATEFSLDLDTADFAAYTGSLFMFVDNAFPTNMNLQIALLDADSNIVFTFFEDLPNETFQLAIGAVDGAGNVIEPSSSGKVELFQFDDNLENIQRLNQGEIMSISASFDTPNATVAPVFILEDSSAIDLLITADIQIDPSKIP